MNECLIGVMKVNFPAAIDWAQLENLCNEIGGSIVVRLEVDNEMIGRRRLTNWKHLCAEMIEQL